MQKLPKARSIVLHFEERGTDCGQAQGPDVIASKDRLGVRCSEFEVRTAIRPFAVPGDHGEQRRRKTWTTLSWKVRNLSSSIIC